MANKTWQAFLNEHKALLTVVTMAFLFMELLIYAMASMSSGTQSRTRIFNPAGDMVYELKGAKLTNFDKYYFDTREREEEDWESRLRELIER